MKKVLDEGSAHLGVAGRILLLAGLCTAAFADPITVSLSRSLISSTADGVTLRAGSYSDQQLASVGNAVGISTAGGFTVWSLLGGNAAGTSSDVVTDSGKNAILRSFLMATDSGGSIRELARRS